MQLYNSLELSPNYIMFGADVFIPIYTMLHPWSLFQNEAQHAVCLLHTRKCCRVDAQMENSWLVALYSLPTNNDRMVHTCCKKSVRGALCVSLSGKGVRCMLTESCWLIAMPALGVSQKLVISLKGLSFYERILVYILWTNELLCMNCVCIYLCTQRCAWMITSYSLTMRYQYYCKARESLWLLSVVLPSSGPLFIKVSHSSQHLILLFLPIWKN